MVGLFLLVALVSRPVATTAAASPQVIIPLNVVLEWQPGLDDNLQADLADSGCPAGAYSDSLLKDLEIALNQTAEYVYTYTQGQVAIGRVTVSTNGHNWQDADIRILVSNDFRPVAYLGGITANPIVYTNPKTNVNTFFYPGAILLGRLWDSQSARCGSWADAAGWRTIGHELGHHAFFLGDGYKNQNTQQAQYCSTTSAYLPHESDDPRNIAHHNSLMAYQYRADQLWADEGSGIPANCQDTNHTQLYGSSEWEVLQHFYPGVAPVGAIGDASAYAQWFSLDWNLGSLPEHTSATINLKGMSASHPFAQTYLNQTLSGQPVRMLYQGQALADQQVIWGVNPSYENTVTVQAIDWYSGGLYTAQEQPIIAGDSNKYLLEPAQWSASLEVQPVFKSNGETDMLSALKVIGRECLSHTRIVEIVFCPAGGRCHKPQQAYVSGGKFSTTFSLYKSELEALSAGHGYVYARNLNNDETVSTWYQLAGGFGPATAEVHAPLQDSTLSVSIEPKAKIWDGGHGTLVYQPAQACSAEPLPRDLHLIGPPISAQPLLVYKEQTIGWNPDLPRLTFQLSYDQTILDQQGIAENQLVVMVYNPSQGTWQQVQILSQDEDLNLLTLDPQMLSGQGLIFAIGY